MTDINHVTLVGRLTRDVGADERSFAYLPSGQARANVSIAVNRSRKNGDQWVEEVSYFDVTIWGKQAESLKPYLTKGKQIAIEGYLRQDRWEKDGQKQSRITITATNVQLLGGKAESGQQTGGYASKFQPKSSSEPMDPASYGGDTNTFLEDIPF